MQPHGKTCQWDCLNFDYSGPIDGHDLNALLVDFERQKCLKGPRLLHIITTKGKGLKQAEEQQVKYHAPGRFDPETGELIKGASASEVGPKCDIPEAIFNVGKGSFAQ